MIKDNYILEDLRHITLFPKRYDNVRGLNWSSVGLNYSRHLAKVESTPWHWYVIEYTDGHKETTYLRVLAGGLFSGKRAAIYRGLVFPRRIDIVTFSHIKYIWLAF